MLTYIRASDSGNCLLKLSWK